MRHRELLLILLTFALFIVGGLAGDALAPKLLEDFEDGDTDNSAADNGISKLNGFWIAGCDSFGDSQTKELEIVALKDGNKAMHVSGRKGTTKDEKWVWSSVQTCFGGDDKWADLRPSLGMKFKARSALSTKIRVSAEGTVNGKVLTGSGADYGHFVTLNKEWTSYTVYWQDFVQPEWVCPGDNCAGKLEVSHIGHLFWNPADEGQEFDIWLDDIELVYQRNK